MATKDKDIHSHSVEVLRAQVNDAREEYMNLRFQQATGELTDFTRLRHSRRQIARLMTILHEREREASAEGVK